MGTINTFETLAGLQAMAITTQRTKRGWLHRCTQQERGGWIQRSKDARLKSGQAVQVARKIMQIADQLSPG